MNKFSTTDRQQRDKTNSVPSKRQPTAFEKIERYITKISEEYGGTIEKSNRSRYFKFNDRVLRLSNHIGKNSSGAISIIVPRGATTENGVFIIHVHSTGNVKTLDFSQLKEFVKTFALVSDFLEPLINTTTVAYVQVNTPCKSNGNTILGYPIEAFSEGQINHIKLFIEQNGLHRESDTTFKNRK